MRIILILSKSIYVPNMTENLAKIIHEEIPEFIGGKISTILVDVKNLSMGKFQFEIEDNDNKCSNVEISEIAERLYVIFNKYINLGEK